MIPAPFEYERPATVDEAAALLREHEDAKILAGGQSLLPLLRLRLSTPSLLVDIGGIAGLDGIRRENGTLVVGALARHSEVHRSPVVREALPLLAEMAWEIGDTQVRNLGTVGGVMGHGDAAGDYLTLAVMLDAEIVTDRRRIPAEDFAVGRFTTVLEHDEVVTEVRFPVATGPHRYIKWRRRLFDWAIVGAAVQRTSDGWRIGLVNAAPTAVRATAAEQALAQGASPAAAGERAAAGLDPGDDVRASGEYKKHLAAVLVQRALEEA